MANNSTSPYFTRFADASLEDPRVDIEFLCLFPTLPEMVAEMDKKGISCHWIPYDSNDRKKGILKAYFSIKKLLKETRPDVVHGHLFDDSLPLLRAAKQVGIPKRVISKLDAGFHLNFSPKWVWMDKMNNRNATHIIAVSEENRKVVVEQEGADPSKVNVIHQGLEESELVGPDETKVEKWKSELCPNNEKLVITVSRFVGIKGQKYLIDAAAEVLRKLSDVRFLLLGYGPEEESLQKLVEDSGLQEHFIFHDWVERDDLNAIYAVADLLCHPAIEEPFGFVVAEAMFLRLPIVCTETGAAADALQHLKSAYLVPKKNPAELSTGILHMLDNNTDGMVKIAYHKAEELFTLTNMWEKHVNLYLS